MSGAVASSAFCAADAARLTRHTLEQHQIEMAAPGPTLHHPVRTGSTMTERRTDCPRHGSQSIALACVHVASAIDSGEQVGFYWGDDDDLGRPDAWCRTCEQKLVALAGASSEQWFHDADFKILCVACWDEAKRRLYDRTP